MKSTETFNIALHLSPEDRKLIASQVHNTVCTFHSSVFSLPFMLTDPRE